MVKISQHMNTARSLLMFSIFLLFSSGCFTPNEIGWHATVGLTDKSLQQIRNHHPVQITVELFENGEEVEITIHRDDKSGK